MGSVPAFAELVLRVGIVVVRHADGSAAAPQDDQQCEQGYCNPAPGCGTDKVQSICHGLHRCASEGFHARGDDFDCALLGMLARQPRDP